MEGVKRKSSWSLAKFPKNINFFNLFPVNLKVLSVNKIFLRKRNLCGFSPFSRAALFQNGRFCEIPGIYIGGHSLIFSIQTFQLMISQL